MNEFEIYFSDLTPEAQAAYLAFMAVSSHKELNQDGLAITTIYKE